MAGRASRLGIVQQAGQGCAEGHLHEVPAVAAAAMVDKTGATAVAMEQAGWRMLHKV